MNSQFHSKCNGKPSRSWTRQWYNPIGSFKGSLHLLCWEQAVNRTKLKAGILTNLGKRWRWKKRDLMLTWTSGDNEKTLESFSKREPRGLLKNWDGHVRAREESRVTPVWCLNNWVHYNPINLDQESANFLFLKLNIFSFTGQTIS